MNYWNILDIEPTVDIKVIKRAYAGKLKLYHPEDDAEGFQKLREAYENALKETKYLKEVKCSNISINEEPVLHNEYDDILLNAKFNNTLNNSDEENSNAKNENLVDKFMSKVHEIYNDFFMRIDINNWKSLLEDEAFWGLSIRESLSCNMLEFLMDNYYLPLNVWRLLNEYFFWTENEDYLCNQFDEDFINFVFQQIQYPYGLRYEFFKKDYKCNYDEFITFRINARNALIDNDLEQCEKALMSAMDLFPDDPDLVRMLGTYYLRIEDSKNAELAFAHLIEINPKEIDGYLNRGYILIKQARIKEAYYDFQNALNLIPDNSSALKGLAECYFYFDKLIEAKLLYTQICETYDYDIDSRIRIMEINTKLIDKYNKEINYNPENVDTLYELAKIYFELDSFEECHKTIKALVKNENVNSDIYLLSAKASASMNLTYESLEYLDKALKAAFEEGKNAYEIFYYRGLVNLNLNNYEEAINDFKSTLKINKFNDEVLGDLAKAYVCIDEYSKAVELCNEAININSSKWIYYYTRGIAYFFLNKFKESRDDHEVVIDNQYSCSDAWYRKGYCHLQLSEYEKAIKCFKKALAWKDDIYEDIHLRIALAYFKLKKYRTALFEANLHCNDNSEDSFGFILMGDIYRSLSNLPKAEEAYLKAYELNPDNYKLLKLLGYYYLNKNELEKAFEYLDKLVDVYNDDEDVYIDLMWLCAELSEFLSGAAAYADYEEFLERNKTIEVNPYILFHYSVILYKKGFTKSMYKLAVENLEKAIKLGLKNGDLLSYLSMIYYELEDRENSIKYAKEALDEDPSNEDYKTRYEGILQYGGKRNFFIFKTRPSSKKTWPITNSLEHRALKTDLPILNINIGENYEEDE